MDNQTFNKTKRELNRQYAEIFGEIPCIQDYSCTRDEFIDALNTAIISNVKIDKLLKRSGKVLDKNSLV